MFAIHSRVGAALLALGLVVAVGCTSASESASAIDAKITPEVRAALEANGNARVWVHARGTADLSNARRIKDWQHRGSWVVQQLQAHANGRQGALRAHLNERGLHHRSYWVNNAIIVDSATGADVDALAARTDVQAIRLDHTFAVPAPIVGASRPRVGNVEWNVAQIRANEVWTQLGSTGEEIVIANIDTGVDFTHDALAAQYRGNLGGGAWDHDYNWWDPSRVCDPSGAVPCDNAGHGTHTMGTMVGGDGAGPFTEDIGVAPGARWIAAKGCEDLWCSYEALLSSGQWILAPTDLSGQNPRADLRPHVVNNSWGGGPGDPFYQAVVQAWVASGIFPAFANGNSGPSCGSAGSPGDYPESFGVGATDFADEIAGFSSRGPGAFGVMKPNASAPGVDVRSSVPGNQYAYYSGTSMATPHVAGTVALLWSAAPALVGDIPGTFELLGGTAVDRVDLGCDGEPDGDPNNTYGEGRIDAFVAVDESPRSSATLQGIVTDANSGLPLQASVRAQRLDDGRERTTTSDATGFYSMRLPIDPAPGPELFDVNVSAFGYYGASIAGLSVMQDDTVVRDIALVSAPRFALTGHVRDDGGAAIEGATVTVVGTPLPKATTDALGAFTIADVPAGDYSVHVDAGPCRDVLALSVNVAGPTELDLVAGRRVDAFGYSCVEAPVTHYDATNALDLRREGLASVELPFLFHLYGRAYSTAQVRSTGMLTFLDGPFWDDLGNIPSPQLPNAAVYALWDWWEYQDGVARVETETVGSAPNRVFVIEWQDMLTWDDNGEQVRVTFEVQLHEGTGLIQLSYRDVPARADGRYSTVGIEDADGAVGFEYLHHRSLLNAGDGLTFSPPPLAVVQGVVTDAVDGAPVYGARVGSTEAGVSTSTDLAGHYALVLPPGAHTVEASADNYASGAASLDLVDDEVVQQDFVLASARATITPGALSFTVMAGQTRSKPLRIKNDGLVSLSFTMAEQPVRQVQPAGGAHALPTGVTSRTPSASWTSTAAVPVLAGAPVLVLMDALPWGSDAIQQVLDDNAIPYDLAGSAELAALDLDAYAMVVMASDQPSAFYAALDDKLPELSAWVEGGGLLWAGAASLGWQGGDYRGPLPGGVEVLSGVFEEALNVNMPEHPLVQGVADPIGGTAAAHSAFANLPAGALVVASGASSGLPALVEYDHGAGRVIAGGLTYEFGFANGQGAGQVLVNGLPYGFAFEPVLDVAWLSTSPTEGSVSPGATSTVNVVVDATGLAPGVYQARLRITTNDPRNPKRVVPVSLVVPAYQQAVNVGGAAYLDAAGDTWAPDQAYRTGSFGYGSASSRAVTTRRAIARTDEDPLFQAGRQDPGDYRFDGLPPGIYAIELRFAEIQGKRPGQRLFDVVAETSALLTAFDIAYEVGAYAAYDHVAYLRVGDGQLNLRFVPRRGFSQPIVNGLRVTHRPDLE